MANSVKKNTVKGGTSTAAAILATAVVEIAVAVARAKGVEIDGMVQAGAIAALTGVVVGFFDFIKHRRIK